MVSQGGSKGLSGHTAKGEQPNHPVPAAAGSRGVSVVTGENKGVEEPGGMAEGRQPEPSQELPIFESHHVRRAIRSKCAF